MLSCVECGSDVDITELRDSDTDAATTLQVRCSECHEERTVEVRYAGIELAVKATVSSHTSDATVKGGSSPNVTSAGVGDEPDSLSDTAEDSMAATPEANEASGMPTIEQSTNQNPEPQPERDAMSGDESVPEGTASEPQNGFEADESVNTDDYETVLSEINAVRGAGVKNLRDRSEVERVANAIGHDALLEFLRSADDAAYRTAVQEATELRD